MLTNKLFPHCVKWPIRLYLRRFPLWAWWTNECNWTSSTNVKERSKRHQAKNMTTTTLRWWWDYWQIGNFQFSLRRGNKLSRVEKKTSKKVKRSRSSWEEWRVSTKKKNSCLMQVNFHLHSTVGKHSLFLHETLILALKIQLYL